MELNRTPGIRRCPGRIYYIYRSHTITPRKNHPQIAIKMDSLQLNVFPCNVVATTPIPVIVLSFLNFGSTDAYSPFCTIEAVDELDKNIHIQSSPRTILNENTLFFVFSNVKIPRAGTFTLSFKAFAICIEDSYSLREEKGSICHRVQVNDAPLQAQPLNDYPRDQRYIMFCFLIMPFVDNALINQVRSYLRVATNLTRIAQIEKHLWRRPYSAPSIRPPTLCPVKIKGRAPYPSCVYKQ